MRSFIILSILAICVPSLAIPPLVVNYYQGSTCDDAIITRAVAYSTNCVAFSIGDNFNGTLNSTSSNNGTTETHSILATVVVSGLHPQAFITTYQTSDCTGDSISAVAVSMAGCTRSPYNGSYKAFLSYHFSPAPTSNDSITEAGGCRGLTFSTDLTYGEGCTEEGSCTTHGNKVVCPSTESLYTISNYDELITTTTTNTSTTSNTINEPTIPESSSSKMFGFGLTFITLASIALW
ncbi:hypothetical protein PROFUN_02778 [Planoprotostelium fungivorum]|uniref:Uncharacterized protein n=1 Tax=Planoprotostelium fungivorum TaxID=1890364 RepID=A0A2P6NXK4_9EUKA|nr:hypothetical protein PROFUN_02778 [Planoprotostelium fungivorum]